MLVPAFVLETASQHSVLHHATIWITAELLRDGLDSPFMEKYMHPLLSDPKMALPVDPNNDPRNEITEEDIIFDSTLVSSTESFQDKTTITFVRQETSDEF